MLSRLWQKFRAHWFKYLLLVACAGAALFGLFVVACFWAFPFTPSYYQAITANAATIGSTPLTNANLPKWLAPVLSMWLLVATVSFVLVLLWLRRQFSLKALLIAVFVAAGLAALPQSLRSPPTTKAEILLLMNSATGQYAPSEAELDAIVDGLNAERFFRTLPAQMIGELRLTPEMLASVGLRHDQTNPTSNPRMSTIEIKLRDGMSPEQSATLCHAISHYVGQEISDAYGRNRSPAPPYLPMNLVINAPSRWGQYLKAWEERRKQLAQQPIPAPPPPSVQVQPK